jgi:hypothetical protein
MMTIAERRYTFSTTAEHGIAGDTKEKISCVESCIGSC